MITSVGLLRSPSRIGTMNKLNEMQLKNRKLLIEIFMHRGLLTNTKKRANLEKGLSAKKKRKLRDEKAKSKT